MQLTFQSQIEKNALTGFIIKGDPYLLYNK